MSALAAATARPPDSATAAMWVVLAFVVFWLVGWLSRRHPKRSAKNVRRTGRRKGTRPAPRPKRSTSKANKGNPETPTKHVPLGTEAMRGLAERIEAANVRARATGARNRELRTQDERAKKSSKKTPKS